MAASTGDHLRIFDSRTKKEYSIPIEDSFIHAGDLSAIKAKDSREIERSLRILDRGFQHTACMESAITLIDGARGEIKYRNIPIQKLIKENDFDDVMHLLIWGSIPSGEQKKSLRAAIARHSHPPEIVLAAIGQYPRDADAQALVLAGLNAYASYDKEAIAARNQPRPRFHGNLEATDEAIIRTMAYITTNFALVYCHRKGISFVPPQPDQSILGNLLLMMGFEISGDPTTPAGRMQRCMERLWILYADHEMTNSTAAALHVGSTLTDPISCFITYVIAGAGPLHAGALKLSYDVLEQVGTIDNVPTYIEAVKAKKLRLFGYGHRMYKTVDPRVELISELLKEHDDLVSSNPLLRVALAVDRTANVDPYFVERRLKVNADLFGCFLYTAFGFERDILPGFGVVGRAAGVLAHWREAMGQSVKIWRPQQKFKAQL